MTEMELREEIRSYEPFNEQEREDKKEILRQMEQADHILTRDNRNAHITGLCMDHGQGPEKGPNGIPQSLPVVGMAWGPCRRGRRSEGGGAEGDPGGKRAGIRPVRDRGYFLPGRSLRLTATKNRGSYVPSHLHLNVTYLLEADPRASAADQGGRKQ